MTHFTSLKNELYFQLIVSCRLIVLAVRILPEPLLKILVSKNRYTQLVGKFYGFVLIDNYRFVCFDDQAFTAVLG
jgi:hypothetical protein